MFDILRENPIVAGAVAAIAAIFVIAIARAVVGRHVESDPGRGRGGQRRLEPGFGGGRLEDAPLRSDYKAGGARVERRRGGGVRTFFAFVLGIAVGFGAFALADRPDVVAHVRVLAARALAAAARSISEPERREAPTVEEETAPKPAEAQERVPGQPVRAARRVDPEERDRHLAEFLRRMRDQLPRQVDDSTSLVRVDNEGDVVTLGFSLTSVVPKELASNIADILRNRFNSNVCDSSTPSEIRTLSEDGVTFRIVYSDQVGTTVARLDIPPNYCRQAG